MITSGFLTIQNWIDNEILIQETNNNKYEIKPSMVSVRIPEYIEDDITLYLKGYTNVFLVLPLILPFLRMIYRLLYEKVQTFFEKIYFF